MKERPILFSGPMVRALLAGTKTQTRRLLNLHPSALQCCCGGNATRWTKKYSNQWHCGACNGGARIVRNCLEYVTCPYGQPGDRLWVREAWRTVAEADALPPRDLNAAHRIWFEADAPHQPGAGRYRPGMFMPRWASRITLEITDVRLERLNDISEEDARAEGVQFYPGEGGVFYVPDVPYSGSDTAVGSFRILWEFINGAGSWDANPWVWPISFK